MNKINGCWNCFSGSTYQVRLGTNHLDINESGSLDVMSRYSIVHENYDPITLWNDIAVVLLPWPVHFSSECSSS